MQTMRTDRGPGTPSLPLSSRPIAQPTITNIVQRELEDFDQRTPRRARVVGRLIFLQVALLLMTAPLAFWPRPQIGDIAVLVGGLAIFAAAWLRNQARQVQQAQALLIGGGGIITAVTLLGQLLWHPGQVVAVGLASLPFILTILETGLLFGPEIVLLVTVATSIVSAVLFTLALLGATEALSVNETYLLAVVSLGVQALAGMIAWQIASFVADYSGEVAQARREEFIVTQYDALRRGTEEQSYRVREEMKALIDIITRLMNRDYLARVPPNDGELKPLGDVINVLAMQMSSLVGNQHEQETTDETMRKIATLAGEIAEGDGAAPPTPPPPTNTRLRTSGPLDVAMVMLERVRARMQTRMGQVRDLAIDAGQRLNQAEEQTTTAMQALTENQAKIGLLRATAERAVSSANRLNALVDDALTALGALLPPDVRAQARFAPPTPTNNPALRQVMPGVTVQLDVITDDTELTDEDRVAGATAPQPIVLPSAAPGIANPHAQAALRDTWGHIIEMTEEVAKQVRDTFILQEELGKTSRSLNEVGTELTDMRQSVERTRQIAQQVYHLASTTTGQLPGITPDVLAQPGYTPPGGINAADLIQRPSSAPRPPSRPLRPDVGEPPAQP